jgi:predicted N-formylglutamate amidohydrolase
VKRAALLLTCEHATNHVPKEHQRVFGGQEGRAVLGTHRGYDLGAKGIAHGVARKLASNSALLFAGPLDGEVTRLLVDLNRSPRHPRVFSTYSQRLTREERAELMRRYYEPHHRLVRATLKELLKRAKTVLHVGVHSFTPELGGQERNVDVGLLYDPARSSEREFATLLLHGFRSHSDRIRVRRNYPYRGIADGVTTMLRREFPSSRYAGFELELNQGTLESRAFARASVDVLSDVLTEWLGRSDA